MGVFAAASINMAFVAPASASEALSGSGVELFKEFLDQIAALGPWGCVLFVVTVSVAEMVPLFPTQPLSIASGLLFGPVQGALCMLLGVTLAAVNAFTISRGVGKKLAERVISAEMGENNAVQQKIAEVTEVIEEGGFWQQLTAIALLRLTPIVPFSASNYVLGLTPVQPLAFVGGTVVGMTVWSILYASLGGTSRVLLEGGADLENLLAEVSEKAGSYTKTVLIVGAVLAVGALAFSFLFKGEDSMDEDEEDEGLTLAARRRQLESRMERKEKVKL